MNGPGLERLWDRAFHQGQLQPSVSISHFLKAQPNTVGLVLIKLSYSALSSLGAEIELLLSPKSGQGSRSARESLVRAVCLSLLLKSLSHFLQREKSSVSGSLQFFQRLHDKVLLCIWFSVTAVIAVERHQCQTSVDEGIGKCQLFIFGDLSYPVLGLTMLGLKWSSTLLLGRHSYRLLVHQNACCHGDVIENHFKYCWGDYS